MSPEVKNVPAIRKPIHDFQSHFCGYFFPISYRYWDIWIQTFQDLILSFDLHKSFEVWLFFSIWKYIHDFLSTSVDTFSFFILTQTFDLQRSYEVQNILTIWEPIHDFLSNFCWHFLSVSHRFWDIRLQNFQCLTSTFGIWRSPEKSYCHSKASHVFLSYFYWHFPSSTVFEIWLQTCQGSTLIFDP